jgi:glycosyltransferase involved in cell wall biosynthesis
MLDAAACGVPIIVSNMVRAVERVRGNGLQYEQGNYEDLVNKILELAGNKSIRRKLGDAGAAKIRAAFSWQIMASRKLNDYYASLSISL